MSKRKKDSIKLSPKYGVNPTIPVCFWCGEDKNEVAMLGHIGDGRKGQDIEAPKRMVLDYDPCDKCNESMNLGITCVEVTDIPPHEGMPEFLDGHYPTGKWVVIKPEAAKRIFDLDLEKGKKLMVSEDAFSAIFTNPIMDK